MIPATRPGNAEIAIIHRMPLSFLLLALAMPASVQPVLNVRLYSFSGVSPTLVADAERNASRLLHDVPVELHWVDCAARDASVVCLSDPGPADLVVRLVPKALPRASANALGIAGSQEGEAVAFLFYDRMLALRSFTNSLPFIVGRVLAHEVTHLLLPPGSHSPLGLMRGEWTAEDLRTGSLACAGIAPATMRLMQTEAQRKVRRARSSPAWLVENHSNP